MTATQVTPITLERHDLVHPDGRAFHLYGPLHGTLEHEPPASDATGLEMRWDLLTGAYVLVSPARNTRPTGEQRVVDCPICPGGVEIPFAYEAAAFDNRFPALSPVAPLVDAPLTARSVGRCQVVVYTPDHEGSVATLRPVELARVVAVWQDRTKALWDAGHAYVMAFENRGAEIGATLSHPHGQLYALPFVPPFVATKVAAADAHRARTGRCVGCDLVDADSASDRQVDHNDSFTVAVPFAAKWPFEVHLRVRRHGCGRLADLTPAEALDLARALQAMVHRYDGLFGFELPYMMVVQEAPAGCDDWHLHVELLPVHRSRDRLKVRASVETALGVFINDTLPERSAERLAAVPLPATSWEGVTVPVITRSRGGNE